MSSPRYVLCIDPGFKNLGVAVVKVTGEEEPFYSGGFKGDTFEVVYVNVLGDEFSNEALYKSSNNFINTCITYNKLAKCVDNFYSDTLCMESLSYSRNAASNAKISMTLGALSTFLLFGRTGDIEVVEAPPQTLKTLCCGSPSAEKEEVVAAVKSRFGPQLDKLLADSKIIKSKHQHIYDALSAFWLFDYKDAQRYTINKVTNEVKFTERKTKTSKSKRVPKVQKDSAALPVPRKRLKKVK